jgi:putative ABC transport system ATP-binding protein
MRMDGTTPAPQAGSGAGEAASIRLTDVHLELASAAGPVNILRGIDLSIAAGEVVSIVGPSGSGKSSMMMLLGGLERPTRGKVEVAGRELSALSEDQLALFRRNHVGIVFQNFHLIPTMTALENVAIPLEFAGAADAFDQSAERLRAVGLGHRLTHYPGQLSGGEQQRTALARAFAADPDVILADEPTGNLDGETGRQVIELMFDLSRRRGATLLLITHDPALAARCDRIVRLVDGRITDAGLTHSAALARLK